MQKVIVLGDSLGNNNDIYATLLTYDWDIAVHLGDYCTDLTKWQREFPGKTFFTVTGDTEQKQKFPYILEKKTVHIENWNILLVHNLLHLTEQDKQGIDAILYTDPLKPEDRLIDGIRTIGTGSFNLAAFTILTINSLEITSAFERNPPNRSAWEHDCNFLKQYMRRLQFSYMFYEYYGTATSKAALASKYCLHITEVYEKLNGLLDQLQSVLRKINGIEYTREQIASLVRDLAKQNKPLNTSLSSFRWSRKYLSDTIYEKVRDHLHKEVPK